MAVLNFYKVTSLPSTLEADSFYFVENGGYAESYLTNNTGLPRSIGNTEMINALIAEALGQFEVGGVDIVADIAERDTLTSGVNTLVLVIDASGDPTVDDGAALYVYNASTQEYIKIAEYESMDVIVQWSSIQGRPTSTPSEIDQAVAELDTKVDKIVGKGLSTEDFTSAEKDKLAELENYDDSAIQAELDTKVDKVTGKGLSDENYTLAEKNKLAGVAAGATKNDTDAQLRDRATHTGVQPISSVTNLQSSLDSKVDKQNGYGLSQENYTPAEKSKLSSLEGSKFKGEYVSLAALKAAQPSPEVGSYAYVDIGVGEVVTKYIWDSSDAEWVKQQGETASLSPAEVKSLYEGNPDTNAFTDSEKTKLAGVQAGAQVNSITTVNGKTGAVTLTHTDVGAAPTSHTHPLSQITGAGDLASLSTNDSTSNFLRGDGTWVTPPNTDTKYSAGTGITLTGTSFSLTDERFTSTLLSKLEGIVTGATKNATDAQLRDRATHTGVQPISSVTNLQSSLDSKVDKQNGYGLSQENFTPENKEALNEIVSGNYVWKETSW